MLLTQRNLQRAEDKLVGLDISKSEFRVTDSINLLN